MNYAQKNRKTILKFFFAVILFVLAEAIIVLVVVRYSRQQNVHITEIHFNPSHRQGDVEYIEITNTGTKTANISGWQLTGAGRISFPAGTDIAPGKSVIATGDERAFTHTFKHSAKPVVVFHGGLRRSGEVVRLEDGSRGVVDEVAYSDTSPTVTSASNTGDSLHRICFENCGTKEIWKSAHPTPGEWRPVALSSN